MTRALIVVDVQNDFSHPEGNLYVPNGDLVPRVINRLLSEYSHIVYTKDWHPPVSDHFIEHGGPWPTHCVGDTWGAEFNADLAIASNAPVVHKGTNPGEDGYSGFYVDDGENINPTELHGLLQAWEIAHVDVVGIALDVCVKATALDANALGYYTTVIQTATAPVTAEGGYEAIGELRDKGVTVA